MQVLATQFTEKGINYYQLAREGMVALYGQQGIGWKAPRYEVILIRVAKEHVWPNGAVSPEQETYPTARVWGQCGWTHHIEASARAQMARLVARRAGEGL